MSHITHHMYEKFCFIQEVPEFIPKMHLYNYDDLENPYGDYYVTEKIDGKSVTFFYLLDNFGVCSKNKTITSKSNIYHKIARKYDIQNKLSSYRRNVAIQGEIVGPEIKNNVYQLKELDLFVFNVVYLDDNFTPGFFETENLISLFGLKMPPVIKESIEINKNTTKEELVQMAKGYSNISSCMREGIVFKPKLGQEDSISFKIINPDYIDFYKK